MADNEKDTPSYRTPSNRMKRAFGEDQRTGQNGARVWAGEFAKKALGETVLGAAFKWTVLGSIAVGGSLIYGGVAHEDVGMDTSINQPVSTEQSYLVSQDIDNRFAVVRNGDDTRVYRIIPRTSDNRFLSSSRESNISVDLWDMVEDRDQALYIANRMVASYATALTALDQGQTRMAEFAAPNRIQYSQITKAYEDDGQIFRESIHTPSTPIQAFELRSYIERSGALWQDAADRIAAGHYGFETRPDDLVRLNDDVHSIIGVAESVLPYAIGAVGGLMILGAAAGASSATRRRISKPRPT